MSQALDPFAAAVEEAEARVRLRHNRGRRMSPAGRAIAGPLRKIVQKLPAPKGAPLLVLKSRWRDIVGDQLFKVCRPEKLTRSKTGRTLTLIVIPAAAPLVQHQAEIIRQRVTASAGGHVDQIRIQQGALHAPKKSASAPKSAALSAEDLAMITRASAGIEHVKLRDAIEALGRAMLSTSKD